jgi:hypothetical protein
LRIQRVVVDHHDLGEQHVVVIVVVLLLVRRRGQEPEGQARDARDDEER